MPRDKEKQKVYAKNRRLTHGDKMRAKNAEWRDKNRDFLRSRYRKRRLEKRAICLAAAARIRARKKGIKFSLTKEDILELQKTIDGGFCELSGIGFTLKGPRSATSPSLDRINPKKGYVSGNVRVICHAMNAALGDWGEHELKWIVRHWMNYIRAKDFI